MSTIFSSLEHDLRLFLHSCCCELSKSDPRFLSEYRQGRYKSYDDLEVGDLCSLLVYNSKKDEQWNLRLFDVVEVSESFRNDLRFVATLRNKYFHLKGRRTLTSNEQLADLLLVERVVEGLSSICNAPSDALQSRLRNSLNDLITQVAQVMMPNQFDQDGEKTVLGVEDREFIKDLFTAGISRLPVHPVPELSSDRSAFPDNRAHEVIEKISAIEKKLKSLTGLKGRLDTLESTLGTKLSSLDDSVFGVEEAVGAILSTLTLTDHATRDGLSDDADDDDFSESASELTNRLNDFESALNQLKPQAMSVTEARDQLITLRKRIWKETGAGPSANGLLRKSMLDLFLHYLPTSIEEANDSMGTYLRTVTATQMPYLDDVIQILKLVDDE